MNSKTSNKLILVVLMQACTCIANASEPLKVIPPQQKILGSEGGRYVFGQISEYRKDQFLLDVKTGRVWESVLGENNRTMLQPIPFIQILGDFNNVYIPDADESVKSHQNLGRIINSLAPEEEKAVESEKALTNDNFREEK